MLNSLKKLFRAPPARPLPAIPAGQRVYAVGDVHGRLDLLVALAEAIEYDNAARNEAAAKLGGGGRAESTVILLGDLVDRGPDSAGVLTATRMWASQRKLRIIAGNHEEMFLESLENTDQLRHFLRYGGRETILSYPIAAEDYSAAEIGELQEMLLERVPAEHVEFIRSFEDVITIGDYVFVHAGIAPGVPLDEQRLGHLRWIREPFLSHEGDHGFVVVHGHTISREIEVLPNRIGIDTGAYESGRLSALCLEGTERWLIETSDHDGSVTTASRAIA